MSASRAVLPAIVSALAVHLAVPAVAQTPGLVVDAASGKVLFAERATDPWYPASITKLMTVYVALDQVRQGRLRMNSLLTMSDYAASQPPSKIGLKPGLTMTLENALKIIMVKSANDIATMIGEGVGGGSVEGFAVLMNEASQRLGMHESRWYNPSGLPDARQQTSARDMAVLARALMSDFPQHASLFSIGAVKLGNHVMRNHNGLLGRYPGADGMKTGFICSGGFNVVATSTQNGRRLIAVVMGYPSARERDLRTADLFDNGFASYGWGAQTVDALAPSASMTAPDLRPIICGGKRRTPSEDDQQAALQANAGNADNPIAALFSPSALGTSTAGTAILGSRRNLGPRVAFDPVPVWIGATPGETAEPAVGGAAAGRKSRIARGKPVRTETVSRLSAPGPAARALTAAGATPSIMEGGRIVPERANTGRIETVKTGLRPANGAALRANLDAKPAAEIKPRHGAIAAKPAGGVAGANPDAKPTGGAANRKTAAPKAGTRSAAAGDAPPRAGSAKRD